MGRTEDSRTSTTAWRILLSITEPINYALIGIVTAFMLWFSLHSHYHNPFSWHVALCTIGYILLMSGGIVVLSGDSIFPRRTRVILHWVFQGAGTIISIAGNAVEIHYTEKFKVLHFQSFHAITGLISMIFLILAACGGIPTLYATELRKYIKPVILKLFHNFLATLAFVIGMISFIASFYTNWFKYYVSYDLRIVLSIAVALITLISLISSLRNGFSQIKSLKHVS